MVPSGIQTRRGAKTRSESRCCQWKIPDFQGGFKSPFQMDALIAGIGRAENEFGALETHFHCDIGKIGDIPAGAEPRSC